MQHRKRVKKLGVKKSHREALLRNLLTSLVLHEKIKTTALKAKVLKAYFETLAKRVIREEPMIAIRKLKKYIYKEEASRKFLNVLKNRYQNRRSGLCKITRLKQRKGDNALLVQIELLP